MINFTVGPVQMEEEIRCIGAEEIPYFRTPEFSALMKENEALMAEFMKAGAGARTLFLTGSGTAAMEAAVMNLFTKKDRLLVVNGGSFGARFAKICRIHGIPHEEIRLESGKALRGEHLAPYAGAGFTGFLVNVHETSTGVYYDMELISRFCRENGLWLVVDAISSFLADDFRMEEWGVDLVLTGSQKALALPPGIGVLVLNERAVKRVQETEVESLYFDLKEYLKDGLRGQTPFTPAVSILIQMNRRLTSIVERGAAAKPGAASERKPAAERKSAAELGLAAEQRRIRELAEDFRSRIAGLPFEIVSEAMSAAETPLHPTGCDGAGNPVSAHRIFEILKDEYGIFICPNGGELADTVFRVGHIGNLTKEDNARLIEAFWDLQRRGLL
ncbi:MAG: aminotransferase class V-fold PLP-dependent enzyme [Pseudomonadota bacterium]|nr:aminotransferase class V-fold PLP-dependent enzyme [Pseudomonadota bacterium]